MKHVLEVELSVSSPKKVAIERLTFAEIAEVTGSEVLAGQAGLEREFSKFSIGAMTEKKYSFLSS